MKWVNISIGAVFFTGVPMSSMGAVLKSQTKAKTTGFFGDLAKGVATAAVGSALGLPPVGMMNPENVAMNGQQQAADQMVQHQRILDKKMQKEVEKLNKLKSKLQFMKDEGLLEDGGAVKALEAPATTSVAIKALAAGKPSPIGGALEDYEAPIIFLEPPPVSPGQLIEASEESQATLERIGEDTSPVMKAIKQYENAKLGSVGASNLQETKEEIRETQSLIKKRKTEREGLVNKMKEEGRELAKTGNKRLAKEAHFTKNDLKEKDKELDILANKLLILKKKEANLISMANGGGGKKGKKSKKSKKDEDEDEDEDF